ncbi:hypothetical protein HMPREF1326_02209 [Akkermansia sp. KLE1605]|nr:hypothetical protein HMPREF1326_02209 [Akkermansia sp. KLE1605]
MSSVPDDRIDFSQSFKNKEQRVLSPGRMTQCSFFAVVGA